MHVKLIFALILVWGVCSCAAFSSSSFQMSHAFLGNGTNVTFTCTDAWTCVDNGDDCTYDWATNPGQCLLKNGTGCCAQGLYCISGTCADNNIGMSCNKSSDCHGPFGTIVGCSANNTCTYLYGPGDSCSNNTECSNNNCTNGVCSFATFGQSCSLSMPCGFGLFCNTTITMNGTVSTCANKVPAGGDCSTYPCYPGTTCFNNNCTTLYSVPSGGKCSSSDLCETGYVCSLTGTCTEAQDSFESCSQQSDCSSGICTCSLYSGDSYCFVVDVDPCTDAASDLNDCIVDNNCTSANAGPQSCAYNNCYSDLKKSQSCGCDLADTAYSSCFYNQYCGGFPVWAIIVIIIAAIVLVLGIVLLVFFMMRRRRVYDSI